MVSYLFVSLIGFPSKVLADAICGLIFTEGYGPAFAGAAYAANKVTIHLYQILRNVSNLEILTKWAAAVAPVRVRGGVVAVPIERPGIRTVVHVTTREHHLSGLRLIVVIREVGA